MRRDEAKAAAEEKERQRKQELAESESRLNFLKAAKKQRTDSNQQDEPHSSHVNLFEQEEQGVKSNFLF